MNYSSADLLLAYYMYKISKIITNSDYTNFEVCYMLLDLKKEISTVEELSVLPESVKWLNKYIDNLIRDLS